MFHMLIRPGLLWVPGLKIETWGTQFAQTQSIKDQVRAWRLTLQPVSHPKKHKSFLGDPGLETGGTLRFRGSMLGALQFTSHFPSK